MTSPSSARAGHPAGGGDGVRRRGQGVVSGGGDHWGQPPEEGRGEIQCHLGLFAVHQFPGIGDVGPIDLADGLVSQAHPKDGDLARQCPDHLLAHPGLTGTPRAGGEDDVAGGQGGDLRHGELVVAHHPDVPCQTSNQLVQVVGEAVVVVNQQNHTGSNLPPRPG